VTNECDETFVEVRALEVEHAVPVPAEKVDVWRFEQTVDLVIVQVEIAPALDDNIETCVPVRHVVKDADLFVSADLDGHTPLGGCVQLGVEQRAHLALPDVVAVQCVDLSLLGHRAGIRLRACRDHRPGSCRANARANGPGSYPLAATRVSRT